MDKSTGHQTPLACGRNVPAVRRTPPAGHPESTVRRVFDMGVVMVVSMGFLIVATLGAFAALLAWLTQD